MRESLTFDFCQMSIFDKYVIVVVNEGVDLRLKQHNILAKIAESHFQNQPFVYISNRVNSYSVDPKIYFETVKIKNLQGLAIVSNNSKVIGNAQIEKLFYQKAFKIFRAIEDAITWAEEMVE